MRPRDAVTGATVLLLCGLVACSDDGGGPLDAGPDARSVDLFVDWGPDPDLPPPPEASPDLPLPPDAGVDALEAGPDGPLPPPHGTCAAPQPASLVSGSATVVGDTGISVDEHPTVSCGHPAGPWPGPQLYYKVALVGNKTYRATLTVTGWDPALYTFSAATTCGATEIDLACTGTASDSVGSDVAEVVVVSPAADGEWIFVVDSFGKTEHGPFTLVVEEITPPPNASCSAPEPVVLVGGSATVVGSTASAIDEGGITCGTGFTFDGPQLYYKVTPSPGTAYVATLTPAGWDATLYAFSPATGCAPAGIDTGCKGNASENAGVGGGETVVLQPGKATEWILAVDSWSSTAAGGFTLQIDETTLPANSTCAGAQAVSLAAGKVSISGDTTLAPDDFGASITCGIAGGWYAGGHQLYYQVSLGANKALKIALSPTFPASLYLFSDAAGCQAQAIEADCASGGITGDVIHLVSAGTTQSFAFAPAATGSYLLAVDTMSAYFGPFTLELEEQQAP